jgi:hypothetical protein
MILKRVEKDNTVKAMYKSSNILASTYDTKTNSLTIIFNRGARYTYKAVSNTDYTRFEAAESQGKILNSHIKKYEYEQLDDIDTTKLTEEINNMSAEESVNHNKVLAFIMSSIVTEFVNSGEISDSALTRLTDKIKQYKSNNE